MAFTMKRFWKDFFCAPSASDYLSGMYDWENEYVPHHAPAHSQTIIEHTQQPEPIQCKQCGAPLRGDVCEYCGSVYARDYGYVRHLEIDPNTGETAYTGIARKATTDDVYSGLLNVTQDGRGNMMVSDANGVSFYTSVGYAWNKKIY